MDIVMITPAPPGSRAGNRATAERWAWLLERDGHRVRVVTAYSAGEQAGACDLFIGLHAWRSHDAVVNFRAAYPEKPLIVALTGTDIYDHQHRFPAQTLETMELADCLIGLHHRVSGDIPAKYGRKLITVLQSAGQPENPGGSSREPFQVCVIGHLRDEKDSLRAALAARLLPKSSQIRVVNAGKPHSPDWETRTREEQAGNSRFTWLGELDRAATQALMKSSKVMVISSLMEGGANVVSEACRAGLPIIASDISGNIGLLGADYPGYYRTGDEEDLARVLTEAESSPEFLEDLRNRVSNLALNFTPEAEQAALARAVDVAVNSAGARG